jgi:hypothetical protein
MRRAALRDLGIAVWLALEVLGAALGAAAPPQPAPEREAPAQPRPAPEQPRQPERAP